MPAYSFKERFVPMVKDGSKPGTIRAFRKTPPRVGQKAHLYFGMRTKFCTKLVAESPDIHTVRCIALYESGDVYIFHGREELSKQEIERYMKKQPRPSATIEKLTKEKRDRLSWLDGFRPEGSSLEDPRGSWLTMYRWWKQTHSLPFIGNHILWGGVYE